MSATLVLFINLSILCGLLGSFFVPFIHYVGNYITIRTKRQAVGVIGWALFGIVCGLFWFVSIPALGGYHLISWWNKLE